MNVVDSSGWLAFLANEPNADRFAKPLGQPESLIVPTIVLHEVFKVLLRELGEAAALRAYAAMSLGTVVDLTPPLALAAAKLGVQHQLPMADSMVLATARAYRATVWTQDAHFAALPDVKYWPK